MEIFKTLHILSLVAMVSAEIGAEFLYAYTISRRDVRGLATIHRILEQARIGIVGIVALVVGVAFGLLTAATGGLDFFAGWLIAAYILVGVILVGASRLWPKTLLPLGAKAVEAEAGQRPVEDVVREMIDSRAVLWFAFMLAILVAIIADMVLKPF